jgi:1,4-dihydroxy-2-naphthoyl-CoA hydrolase
MAINNQEGRLFVVRHMSRLSSPNDDPRVGFWSAVPVFDKNLTPPAQEMINSLGLGSLADKMGIEVLELSAERSIGTMPVEGNTQPLALLHGGAYVVLAETLGSFSANFFASPLGKYAVGIEVNASHNRSATSGIVTGVCTSIHLGSSLTTHEIAITDDQGRRVSTVRITNFLKERS